jgi:hypothetical protein
MQTSTIFFEYCIFVPLERKSTWYIAPILFCYHTGHNLPYRQLKYVPSFPVPSSLSTNDLVTITASILATLFPVNDSLGHNSDEARSDKVVTCNSTRDLGNAVTISVAQTRTLDEHMPSFKIYLKNMPVYAMIVVLITEGRGLCKFANRS